jgi:glycolate oxidase iron-sulfur subunit
MFRNEALAAEAKAVSEIAMDVSEVLMKLDLPEGAPKGLKIAYHAACSLQHGQQIKTYPKDLLKRAGFKVSEPVDSHLCCGSAGTYNLMQPEISGQLKTAQGRDAGDDEARHHRGGEYRLHDADRIGHGHPHRAYG